MTAQFVLDQGVLDTDLLGPVVIASASADFGGLSANGNSLVTHLATLTANLGGLQAEANVVPQVPVVAAGGGMPNFVQPNFPQPEPQREIEVSTIVASAFANLGVVKSSSVAEITFSILEDDAEVLLLI